ncbi:hypothetical protein Cgig2_001088 [Carnegiea gigantea]|uniref:RNase H type-1 domain-containing protein n=1 Tax=Carnegiea gigantea TaxID=171969 RepID=A0A9Q1Q821_9CARY|nr:hypothetical protein Cgig2_001088 [Carnegiea gigantea]
MNLVKQCLNPAQANKVPNIPLGNAHDEDKLIWSRTESCTFTVKSAILLTKEMALKPKTTDKVNCSGRRERDFRTWSHSLAEKFDGDECGLLVSLIWGLWSVRNKWAFERKWEEEGHALTRYVDEWRAYVDALEMKAKSSKKDNEEESGWTPPGRGVCKINMDAAVGRDKKRGVGVVARNEKGELLLSACSKVTTNWDVETCTAFAVYQGLRICRGEGITNIMLETYSILVANALNGRGRRETYASNFVIAALDIASSVQTGRVETSTGKRSIHMYHVQL